MSQHEIIRALKDADFRSTLTDAERAQLPQHPVGLIELADSELDAPAGGDLISYLFCSWALGCLTR
jgi:mersacidin/lichenicidin family type 2 lantibiotic